MRAHTVRSLAPIRRAVALITAAAALVSWAHPAQAAVPSAPEFGSVIEDYASYQGQAKCKPKPKPGVVAFEDLLLATYPDSSWFGISRGCKDGGQSEHKEGRALDWSRDASDPQQRATVRELLGWLFAADQFGNTHAMLRRLGIMYIVWNRRIWSTWDHGWEVYCVQKRKICRDPDSKSALNPHIDHVHFSFGWPGARMQTSYWHPELSFVAPAA